MAGGRGGNGGADEREFMGVLDPARIGECLPQPLGSGVGPRGSERHDGAAATRIQPRLQVVERLAVGGLPSFPNPLCLRDRRREGTPARRSLARVEDHHAAGALLAGRVEVLRMRTERVRLVAALRQRHGLAGVNEQDRIAQGQGGGKTLAAGREDFVIHGGWRRRCGLRGDAQARGAAGAELPCAAVPARLSMRPPHAPSEFRVRAAVFRRGAARTPDDPARRRSGGVAERPVHHGR